LSNEEKLTEVYKTTNDMEAQVIRGLLESYGIPCVLRSNAAPSVFAFTVDGMGKVKIMVRDSMADRAKELIVSDKNV